MAGNLCRCTGYQSIVDSVRTSLTMTEAFFVRPSTLEQAFAALETPGSMLVGGATATALLLKNRLIEPRTPCLDR